MEADDRKMPYKGNVACRHAYTFLHPASDVQQKRIQTLSLFSYWPLQLLHCNLVLTIFYLFSNSYIYIYFCCSIFEKVAITARHLINISSTQILHLHSK